MHCPLGHFVPKASQLVSFSGFYSAVIRELKFDAITDKQCLVPSSQIPVATEEITKPVKSLGAAGPGLSVLMLLLFYCFLLNLGAPQQKNGK